MKPLALSLFASTAVAAAAYLVPHLIAMQLNRRIIAENDKVREFLTDASATTSSGQGMRPASDGLFGSYL